MVTSYPGLPDGVAWRTGTAEDGRPALHLDLTGRIGATPITATVVLLPEQLRSLALLFWDEAHLLSAVPGPRLVGDAG